MQEKSPKNSNPPHWLPSAGRTPTVRGWEEGHIKDLMLGIDPNSENRRIRGFDPSESLRVNSNFTCRDNSEVKPTVANRKVSFVRSCCRLTLLWLSLAIAINLPRSRTQLLGFFRSSDVVAREISLNQMLMVCRSRGALVIDLRSAAYFLAGRIPQAQNRNAEQLRLEAGQPASELTKASVIVLYSSGR